MVGDTQGIGNKIKVEHVLMDGVPVYETLEINSKMHLLSFVWFVRIPGACWLVQFHQRNSLRDVYLAKQLANGQTVILLIN